MRNLYATSTHAPPLITQAFRRLLRRRILVAGMLLVAYLLLDTAAVSRHEASPHRAIWWFVPLHLATAAPFVLYVGTWLLPVLRSRPAVIRWPAILALGVIEVLMLLTLAGFASPVERLWGLHSSDFAHLYAEGTVPLRFGWTHAYDVGSYISVFTHLGIPLTDPRLPGFSLSPPPLIAFFVLFALLPFDIAFALWSTISVAAITIAATLQVRSRGAVGWALGGALLLMPAFWFALSLGGQTVAVAALISMAWWFAARGQNVLAGALLAGVLFKPQLGCMIPVALLLAGRWRIVATSAGVAAALIAIPVFLISLPNALSFITDASAAAAHPRGFLVGNQTFHAMLPGEPILVYAIDVFAVVLMAVVTLRRRDVDLAVVAGILTSLIITPYLHSQDLVMLWVAGAIASRRFTCRPAQAALYVSWIAVAIATLLVSAIGPILEVAWLVAIAVTASHRLQPHRADGRREPAQVGG